LKVLAHFNQHLNDELNHQIMTDCSATLSSHERRMLRALLKQESQIVDRCNRHLSQFSDMMNDLQYIRHHQDFNERVLKCDEFIRTHARLDCDMPGFDMVHGAVQTAMTCDCICIQAACFRMLYKLIPQLDTLRMKLLKIKNMCSTMGSTPGVETCANIEKTVLKILKLKPTSH
jgi:hypothetical protein